MSNPASKEMNTTETKDETQKLTGNELRDVNNASGSPSTPILSAVARQTKPATDLLTKRVERLCDLLKELGQAPPICEEETSGLIQGSSRASSHRFDTVQVIKLIWFKFWETFSLLVSWTFKIFFSKIWVFAVTLKNNETILIFLNTRNAILMTTPCIFIIFDYVITFCYSHLQMINQRWFILNQGRISVVQCWKP